MDSTLEEALLNSAREHLSHDFGENLPSGSTIQDYALELSKASFSKKFGYIWYASGCNPPTSLSGATIVCPTSQYRVIGEGENVYNACSQYVDQALNGLDLNRASGNVRADLAAQITECVTQPVDNDWNYQTGSLYYNAAVSGQNSLELDYSFAYSNSTSTGSAVEPAVHVIHFVGVYFTNRATSVESTVEQWRKLAYQGAESLRNVNMPPVQNDINLEKNLYHYAAEADGLFQMDFHRLFKDKPPNVPTDETDPIYTTASHLGYFGPFKEDRKDSLDDYVSINIVDGFNLPNSELRAWAKNLILPEIKSAFALGATNMWLSTCINQMYGSYKDGMRPIAFNAEVVYWNSEQQVVANGKSQQVDVIYIYFLGLIYELEEDPIIHDLAHQLALNIPGINQSSVPQQVTQGLLRQYVETYNCDQFAAQYGIVFPPDSSSSDSKGIRYWRAFFEFDAWNPSKDAISNAVDNQIFPADNNLDDQIHHNLQAPIHDWIVTQFMCYSTPAYAKDPNVWYAATASKDFPYTADNGNWALNVETSWGFVDATLTENDETIQRVYLSLLLRIAAIQQ